MTTFAAAVLDAFLETIRFPVRCRVLAEGVDSPGHAKFL